MVILYLSQIKCQNKNNNNKVLIKKEEFSNNIYFEDYEIKFQVIDNNYKEKFPKRT